MATGGCCYITSVRRKHSKSGLRSVSDVFSAADWSQQTSWWRLLMFLWLFLCFTSSLSCFRCSAECWHAVLLWRSQWWTFSFGWTVPLSLEILTPLGLCRFWLTTCKRAPGAAAFFINIMWTCLHDHVGRTVQVCIRCISSVCRCVLVCVGVYQVCVGVCQVCVGVCRCV